MQKLIFPQKIKKICVLQRRACNKFKRNYLENYNDSEHAVKTKNAPFFMIFPNISFFHMVVNYWTDPLNFVKYSTGAARRKRYGTWMLRRLQADSGSIVQWIGSALSKITTSTPFLYVR